MSMHLLEQLRQLSDFRRGQGRRYPLLVVLLLTRMRIMSGRCRYREIAAFARANQHELVRFFRLNRKRLPSHVTIRAILKGIDFEAVLTAFNAWAEQSVTRVPGDWLSIAGKALASTVPDDETSYQNFVSLVRLFSHKRGPILKVESLENRKSSELPAVRTLLEALDLHGMVFSLEALHCQKKPSRAASTVGRTL